MRLLSSNKGEEDRIENRENPGMPVLYKPGDCIVGTAVVIEACDDPLVPPPLLLPLVFIRDFLLLATFIKLWAFISSKDGDFLSQQL